ncbi:MAG: hypothetical protein A3K19_07080 [Lentisphaerae bacterium RIFOXYB12_FULL_65_16]|nr:MAG: hypothetical protein A3K18_12245 [Lentisphaerae bacterium RIFOXYA12_64_32]OGV93285.1 MAG: hypothetical protein A3K19_07080 [Lentisphaerae bacterium RIFOXYB12_FULL_65_16]
MDNCVFCRIIAGGLPSDKVYEDDLVVAFLDIAPLCKGHSLIVPKEHHNSLTTLPPVFSARMMEVAPKLGVALMRAVGGDGFNLLLSNGACAGQVVPHVHLHVIPRRNDDGVRLPAKTTPYDNPEEKADILSKTKARLNA